MSETPIERVWRELEELQDQIQRDNQARVDRGEAECPTCSKIHTAESKDGYEFCPTCKALCPQCHGFGGGGYGHGPSKGLYHAPLPREEWPGNFTEDAECPGLGVWSCSYCGRV